MAGLDVCSARVAHVVLVWQQDGSGTRYRI